MTGMLNNHHGGAYRDGDGRPRAASEARPVNPVSEPSYVILKWNQAGGMPHLADNEVYDNAVEAAATARMLTREAAPRQDRYTIHPLHSTDQVGWRDCTGCGGKGGTVGVGMVGQQDADCDVCNGSGVEVLHPAVTPA